MIALAYVCVWVVAIAGVYNIDWRDAREKHPQIFAGTSYALNILFIYHIVSKLQILCGVRGKTIPPPSTRSPLWGWWRGKRITSFGYNTCMRAEDVDTLSCGEHGAFLFYGG
jgi:hypothetical protein